MVSRSRLEELIEKIWKWLAWHLPRRLVYWGLIRAWSEATTGEYSFSDATKVTADEVLERWEDAP